MASITIGLVGNPNCGKTTLFNALTGTRQQVGNWPGVTVERRTGVCRWQEHTMTVIDLPGVYSLTVVGDGSVDEQIARDAILARDADVIVNILDAANLERNLYLSAQLMEMRVPTVLALNMMDVARERRIEIDCTALARRIGCPVVPIVAARSDGLDHLMEAIVRVARRQLVPSAEIDFGHAIEGAVSRMLPSIEDHAERGKVAARWLALALLEGDGGARARVPATVSAESETWQTEIFESAGDDADILIASARFAFAHGLVQHCVDRKDTLDRTTSDRIDRVVLHRVFGIPIFLVVMYLLFLFTVNFGGAFIDFFDILFGTVLVDGGTHLLSSLGSPEWLTVILAGGVGGGIQTVATFIPIIACLFLFLSFLEDSGYMARAAFVMDRLMRSVGLAGKSFIPLIVGFGCNVPAIMATRTLDNRRDRILTVMMAPFMSCGARLPVYALFAAAFFPGGGQNVVFALYLIGIAFAIMTGLVLKNTLLRGEPSPFVMELPPYHLPTLNGMLIRTWERLKGFLFRAGKVIVCVVVVLHVLDSLGTDGSFGNENTDRSVLATVAHKLTPAVEPMGITEDNWPATVGMLTGIFAKEAVVGTLNALYGSIAESEAGEAPAEETPFVLMDGIREAFATIPANLAELSGAFLDPLGVAGVDGTQDDVAADQEVDVGVFGAMASRFDGPLGAFAYLLAVLLYMPCVAAMAAIWRETGPRWAVFAAFWTTGLGYSAAVLTFQIGTFDRHPSTAALWISGIIGTFIVVLAIMRFYGQQSDDPRPLPAE